MYNLLRLVVIIDEVVIISMITYDTATLWSSPTIKYNFHDDNSESVTTDNIPKLHYETGECKINGQIM